MSGPSHAPQLVLKLAGIEAAHGGSAVITKDHLFLGLLKVVDLGLQDYLAELSMAEQLATTGEIESLRTALGDVHTTKLRRSLRNRACCHERPHENATARPRLSRECEKLLSQLSATTTGWGCLGLLGLLLESPGKETLNQLKEDGIDARMLRSKSIISHGQREPIGIARAVLRLHQEWRMFGGDSSPELSDLWRRIAPSALIEFDGLGGFSITQGNHCLLRLTSAESDLRVPIIGTSLSQAISEFEEGVTAPCKAPLAEF